MRISELKEEVLKLKEENSMMKAGMERAGDRME
jgi:hypothetical protein